MSNNNVVRFSITLVELAKKAKRLKRIKPELNLHQAQDEVAKQHGFSSYYHARNALANFNALPDSMVVIDLDVLGADKTELALAIAAAQGILSDHMHASRRDNHAALERQLTTVWDLLTAVEKSASLPSVQAGVRGAYTMLSVDDPDLNLDFLFECYGHSEVAPGKGDICNYPEIRSRLRDADQETVLYAMMLHVMAEWRKTPTGQAAIKQRSPTTLLLAENQHDPYLAEITRRCGFATCKLRPGSGDHEWTRTWRPESYLEHEDLWDRMYLTF